MKPSLREVRELSCRIISDRLDLPIAEARVLLKAQLGKEIPHLGRALSVEELEEHCGVAVSEILSNHDPIGRD
jgi:hypothetical protein